MKGLDRAARQLAALASSAMNEALERIWPMNRPDLVDYLTTLEEREEVHEPRPQGSRVLPWEFDESQWIDLLNDCCCETCDTEDPSTGAAGPSTPRPADAGAGGRPLDELTWVLTVTLRRHLSRRLGLSGAVAPLIAKDAAAEVLEHFTVDRRHP